MLENTYLGIQISLDSAATQKTPLRISDNNLIDKKFIKKNQVPSLCYMKICFFHLCIKSYHFQQNGFVNSSKMCPLQLLVKIHNCPAFMCMFSLHSETLRERIVQNVQKFQLSMAE